jgi:allantoinase
MHQFESKLHSEDGNPVAIKKYLSNKQTWFFSSKTALLILVLSALLYYCLIHVSQTKITTKSTTITYIEDALYRYINTRIMERKARERKPYCNDILVLTGSKVIMDSRSAPQPATIIIRNGKIENVVPQLITLDQLQLPKNATCQSFIDAGSNIVMPGMVDTHVHVNEPGRTHWEGFETVTKAAAAAGITTIVDMPLNSLPPTTNVQNLWTKIDASNGKRFVDVGFLGGIIPGNEQDLIPLWNAGVLGFKSFMIHSGVDEFPAVSEQNIENALHILNGTNAVYMFHAEVSIPEVDEQNRYNFPLVDGRKYINFLNSRPPIMETVAVEKVINICKKEYGVRCHIVHVSAAEVLPLLKEARKKSDHITAETCTHYLYFNSEEIPDGATEYKCCPPIRNATNKEMLWEALREDVISMVTSDHSPSPLDMKNGDFLRSWGGISSLEVSLPAMVNPTMLRNFSFNDLVKWKCEETAKLVGLENQKGKIKPGFDGDLVIWNPSEAFVLNVQDETLFKHKHKASPFHNRVLQGRVKMSILRGNVIYDQQDFGVHNEPRGNIILGSRS